jgi:hypothetical protein
MSNYVRWYNDRKDFYKVFASRWAAWAEGAELTELEVEGMAKFFKTIAKRFGLMQDFAALGIL